MGLKQFLLAHAQRESIVISNTMDFTLKHAGLMSGLFKEKHRLVWLVGWFGLHGKHDDLRHHKTGI